MFDHNGVNVWKRGINIWTERIKDCVCVWMCVHVYVLCVYVRVRVCYQNRLFSHRLQAGSENCARLLTDPPPECRSVCCHQGARFSRGALASENWADRLRPCWFTAQVKGRRQDMHENCPRRGIVATSTRRGRTRAHTHSHVQRHAHTERIDKVNSLGRTVTGENNFKLLKSYFNDWATLYLMVAVLFL